MIINLSTTRTWVISQQRTFISFTHKMAAKTSWHRYGTKLRHCHDMYFARGIERATNVAFYFVRPSVCLLHAGIVSKRS